MHNFILLFYAFIKVGILGYGGGHSIIPFIQVEAVENYKWISMEEFTDTLAMANTLPGPIAVKMSFMVGYKTAGLNGAMVSLLGLLLPFHKLLYADINKNCTHDAAMVCFSPDITFHYPVHEQR